MKVATLGGERILFTLLTKSDDLSLDIHKNIG
jgi:hypothetical protein